MKLLLPFLIFGTIYAEERKRTEVEKFKEVTKTELPLPYFLCKNQTTPSTFIKHGMTPVKDSIIKLGIQIDNYSGYTLKNPIFHPYNGHATKCTNATTLEEVLPHRTEFVVLKNSDYVYGSLSWEIFLGEKHTKRRMVVTFGIPYKYAQSTHLFDHFF